MSSMPSTPIESLIKSGVTPAAFCCCSSSSA